LTITSANHSNTIIMEPTKEQYSTLDLKWWLLLKI
jgi:hypothetical protein